MKKTIQIVGIVTGALIVVIAIIYVLFGVIPQHKRNVCLTNAYLNYSSTWSSDCINCANQGVDGYRGCLAIDAADETYCKSLWGSQMNDPSANCSLPTATANAVSDQLKNDEQACSSLYPAI